MVTRPVFSPQMNGVGVLVAASRPFKWNPGFAASQKRKNVAVLHTAIREADSTMRPLEISSKSEIDVGVRLSAFNLGAVANGKVYTVESVFQASKVFDDGNGGRIGSFPDLYGESPWEVREHMKKFAANPLVAFQTGDNVWNVNPTRAFYDWVYCRALHHNPDLVEGLSSYNCFTDIEFNPVRSLNCQAYAVALYLSLAFNGVLEDALSGKEAFLRHHPEETVAHSKTNSVQTQKRKGIRNGTTQGLLCLECLKGVGEMQCLSCDAVDDEDENG